MFLARAFTQPGQDFITDAHLRGLVGDDFLACTVPQHWSAAAVELLCRDVFCPHPLPAMMRPVEEPGVPAWLWRHEADPAALDGVSAEWRYRYERDVRDVLHRMAGSLAYQGWKAGAFADEEEARVFYDEYRYVLFHQLAAPDLAAWRQQGLYWAYGVAEASALRRIPRLAAAEDEKAFERIRLEGARRALEEEPPLTVTLPVENPGSTGFMGWKRAAETQQAAYTLGRKALEEVMHGIMDACDRESFSGFDPARNAALGQAVARARRAGVEESVIQMALRYAEQGHESFSAPKTEDAPRAEDAIRPVLSVPETFMESALTGHGFRLFSGKHLDAEKFLEDWAEALWASGAPGVLFRAAAGADVAPETGGGFLAVPGTEAPAMTLRLMPAEGGGVVDVPRLKQAVQVCLRALDIAAPEKHIMLGMTNIAGVLMHAGLAYDSDAGRATAAALAAFVSGTAHAASARLAERFGAAEMAKAERQRMAEKDMRALRACADEGLRQAAEAAWAEAAAAQGFRHKHMTGIDDVAAEVQILLDAQTAGLAPERALVRFEGFFSDTLEGARLYGQKLNPAIPAALVTLGYPAQARDDIHFYALGHGTLLDAPVINHESLRQKGFHRAALEALEAALKTALDIRYAFNKWTLGEDFCAVLGFTPEEMEAGSFDMLTALGFTEDDIAEANIYCCGARTLEGAPRLDAQHLPVFDCASPCGGGVRCVSPLAQVRMQAALEPFLSGAAAHTLVLDYYATIDNVYGLIRSGWELGVKTMRVYRENGGFAHVLPKPTMVLTRNEENQQFNTNSRQARAG